MHDNKKSNKKLKNVDIKQIQNCKKSLIINDVLETNIMAIATAFDNFFVSICRNLVEAFEDGELFEPYK